MKKYRSHGEEIAEVLRQEEEKKLAEEKKLKKATCRHWWVVSGTGLRCKICGSRQKGRIGG